MNDDKLNARVGAGVLCALALAVALVLGMEGEHVRSGVVVHVELNRTGPLQEGHKLRVAGRVIGSIDRIRLLPRRPQDVGDPDERARVVVDVWVESGSAWMIRENSELFISSQGLLGEPYLEAGPPRGGEPGAAIRDGLTMRGVDPPRIDRLMQKSYENLVAVTNLFKTGMPEAQALGRELSALGENIDAIEAEAGTSGTFERAKRAYDEGVALVKHVGDGGLDTEELARILAKAQTTLARARREIAALRKKIDHFVATVDPVVARLQGARLERLQTALDRADLIAEKLEKITQDANALIAMVRGGEGSLGALLADTEIFDEIKAMTKAVKAQPWRTMGHWKNKQAASSPDDPIVP